MSLSILSTDIHQDVLNSCRSLISNIVANNNNNIVRRSACYLKGVAVACLRDEGGLAREYSKLDVIQWSEELYEQILIDRTKDACKGEVDVIENTKQIDGFYYSTREFKTDKWVILLHCGINELSFHDTGFLGCHLGLGCPRCITEERCYFFSFHSSFSHIHINLKN